MLWMPQNSCPSAANVWEVTDCFPRDILVCFSMWQNSYLTSLFHQVKNNSNVELWMKMCHCFGHTSFVNKSSIFWWHKEMEETFHLLTTILYINIKGRYICSQNSGINLAKQAWIRPGGTEVLVIVNLCLQLM